MATNEQVAAIAHRLWQQRGCPEGSPEVDWERALQLVNGKTGEGGKAGVDRAVREDSLARARSEMASGEFDVQG